MTFAGSLLWLVALMSLCLGALLALPVTVRARAHVDEDRLWGQIRAAWAWGIASATLSPEVREVRFFGLALRLRPKREPAARPSAPRKAPRRRPKLTALLGHVPVLLSALRRLLAALRVRWSIEGQAGFDDPADTAIASALVRQVALALPAPVRIAIEPDYLEPVVRLRSTLVVRLWFGAMVFIALRQLARRDVRQALRALRS